MNKQERLSRVIARGEVSNHSHIVTGDAVVRNENGEIIISVGSEGAVLKHLLETEWMQGREAWTGEHTDIPLKQGEYKFIQQQEYDPYQDLIRAVAD
jgi:hypothetical protein